ncbi:hypothetical protein C483_13318 [Natrialba hulunbeirensis JCM 10989]|uniref:Uncharacterized protein n=1 Tax=Natrialba hulunbeirensis JCM 10989 TaxID=1227493 RepID=L9ZWJ5_9EURY|nr:hypothetical protein [Natrialba hulunbeirensis]ELY89508.1 hypothetical protein C483_13318 [Natrialba hulunbeirensis JCM 10989]
MAEMVDVQQETIGIGTVAALVLYGYGTVIDETLFGYEATTLAMWVFVGTFAAVAVFHGAYGRRDFAAAHGTAALGLAIFLLASDGPQALLGLVLLLGGGIYIAVKTVRARRELNETASSE